MSTFTVFSAIRTFLHFKFYNIPRTPTSSRSRGSKSRLHHNCTNQSLHILYNSSSKVMSHRQTVNHYSGAQEHQVQNRVFKERSRNHLILRSLQQQPSFLGKNSTQENSCSRIHRAR